MFSELEDSNLGCRGPTPAWADGYIAGHIVLYAQLATRDGRWTGNGVIVKVYEEKNFAGDDCFAVLTDFGNIVVMSRLQIERQFYPPEWRMKKELAEFRRKSMAVYLEFEREVQHASTRID